MRILGIDPGLKATGYGLIDVQNQKIKLIETGTIIPQRKNLFEHRLNRIYQALTEILDEFQPQTLVLEKLYAHYKHPTTASVLGHVRGVICLCCAQKGLKLVEHSVKRIRKSITGNGAASKQQTQRVVAQLLGISSTQLTLDASDALALAIGYVRISGAKI